MVKRVFDIVVSVVILMLLWPLLVLVSFAIWVTSGRPILYRGRRVGRYGEPFRIIKFRTMVPHAERQGKTSGERDPRITRLGRLLRRSKLDELPQLINVLTGQMSLVGPRPEFEDYARLFTEEEKEIFNVRPGITDLASIKFRNLDAILEKSGDPERHYIEHVLPQKNRLRLEYVRNRSHWGDLTIIVRTVLGFWFE